MCYGQIDPKILAAETEARLASVARVGDAKGFAWVRALLGRLVAVRMPERHAPTPAKITVAE